MEKSRSIIGLNLSVFLFMLGVGMIVPLLPQKIIHLTGSLKTVGCLASAFAVPFVLLQFPIGHFSDRYGFRPFLLGGYLICSASGLLYCFANTPEMVFLGRLLQGMGEAPLWALAPALLSHLCPKAKGKAIGYYNASLHLGLTLGSALGIIIAGYWVNHESFLLFAVLGGIGAFLVFGTVKDPRTRGITADDTLDIKSVIQLFKGPGTIAVLSGIILYGAGYGIFLTLVPGVLTRYKGFTPAEIGWFFMLFYIGIGLSQIVTGPISDRHGRRTIMVFGLIMISLGFGLFPGQTGWGVYPWLFLASVGLGVFCVSALAWMNTFGHSFKGTISGTFYLFWGIGFFSGPLALGAFSHAGDGFAGFYILALLYFVQALWQGAVRYRGENICHGSR